MESTLLPSPTVLLMLLKRIGTRQHELKSECSTSKPKATKQSAKRPNLVNPQFAVGIYSSIGPSSTLEGLPITRENRVLERLATWEAGSVFSLCINRGPTAHLDYDYHSSINSIQCCVSNHHSIACDFQHSQYN